MIKIYKITNLRHLAASDDCRVRQIQENLKYVFLFILIQQKFHDQFKQPQYKTGIIFCFCSGSTGFVIYITPKYKNRSLFIFREII